MATIIQAQDKAGNYVKYNTKSKMRFILNYVNDPKKTRPELQGGTYLTNPDQAYGEFMMNKQLWGKDQEGKRMCMHYIQSFAPGEVTPEQAKKIADEFVREKIFEGFQISYAVHTDKPHIHTHFIVNTVNVEDGHKWQLADLKILRKISDQICRTNGLSVLPESTRTSKKSPAQKDAESQGKGWKKETQMAVDEALKIAIHRADFIKLMQLQGYQVRWEESRKYILFINPDGKKMRNRLFEFPENYTKEALLERFKENQLYQEGKKDLQPDQPIDSDIRDAANTAVSKDDFICILNAQGYQVQWDEQPYITFSMDGRKSVKNCNLDCPQDYTKERLEEKFQQNKERLEEMKDGTYQKNEALDEFQIHRGDLIFLLNSIFTKQGSHSYPHQSRSRERSVREIEEWRREMEKGKGMDWER